MRELVEAVRRTVEWWKRGPIWCHVVLTALATVGLYAGCALIFEPRMTKPGAWLVALPLLSVGLVAPVLYWLQRQRLRQHPAAPRTALSAIWCSAAFAYISSLPVLAFLLRVGLPEATWTALTGTGMGHLVARLEGMWTLSATYLAGGLGWLAAYAEYAVDLARAAPPAANQEAGTEPTAVGASESQGAKGDAEVV